MPGDRRLSARFGADTTDFKNGIKEINQELKLVNTGFAATSSTMRDWANDATGLEARIDMLNKTIDLEKEKCDALKFKQQEMAKAHGENSFEAKQAQIAFNQEAEKLGRLQTELGQTTTSLKAMKSQAGGVKGAFQDFGKSLQQLEHQVPGLGTAIRLLSNPIALAAAGLVSFAAASDKSIKKTVEFNKSIREMMQYTGLSAEETSRLMEVMEDWGIETGEATKAMEMMNKKGVTPSIENLAKIADDYTNASDKTAFAEEANKKYGKSFVNLIPLIARGGDALKTETASVEKNLLATDASIKAGRDYEVATEKFSDAIKALEFALGTKLLPIVTKFIDLIGELTWTNIEAADVQKLLIQLHEKGLITDKQMAIALRDLRTGTKSAAEITKQYAIETEKYNKIQTESQKQGKLYAQGLGIIIDKTENATEATEDLTEANKDNKYEMDQAERAADKLNQQYDDLNQAIGGRLGPEMEDFTENQADLEQQMKDVQSEIDKAIADGYDPLGEKVMGLKDDYDKLKGQYGENEKEHDRATKEIMFDILQQRLSIGGLTADEVKMLETIALNWGLTDQATIDYMANADEAGKFLATHKGDYDTAEKILNGQTTAWAEAKREALLAHDAAGDYSQELSGLDGKEVHTYIYEHRIPTGPGGGGEHHYQHGGVEYVTQPTLFMAGEPGTGGETAIFIPGSFSNSLKMLQQMINQAVRGMPLGINGGANYPGQSAGGGNIIANTTINSLPGQSEDLIARKIVARIKDAERFRRAGGDYAGV